MEYKAVIFDLDGTLLDTLQDIADAANRVLLAAGLPVHPVDRYRYFVGEGLQKLIEHVLPAEMRNDELISRLILAFREDYGKNWKVRTGLYEGVPELLDGLQKSRVKMAVLSNKPHEFTMVCVREFMADWPFTAVLGQREGVPRKPDPAGALEIARLFDEEPGHILYLGDTATDMETAMAANMLPVGALWGFRTRDELLESGAVHIVSRPAEVLGLVGIIR